MNSSQYDIAMGRNACCDREPKGCNWAIHIFPVEKQEGWDFHGLKLFSLLEGNELCAEQHFHLLWQRLKSSRNNKWKVFQKAGRGMNASWGWLTHPSCSLPVASQGWQPWDCSAWDEEQFCLPLHSTCMNCPSHLFTQWGRTKHSILSTLSLNIRSWTTVGKTHMQNSSNLKLIHLFKENLQVDKLEGWDEQTNQGYLQRVYEMDCNLV